jgi:hypothetical protein
MKDRIEPRMGLFLFVIIGKFWAITKEILSGLTKCKVLNTCFLLLTFFIYKKVSKKTRRGVIYTYHST